MVLKTKSILEKPSKEDGLRICVMRTIRSFYDFDIWWKRLAPSLNLLRDYNNSKIEWEEYVVQYKKEVLIPCEESVRILSGIAMKKDITLLCHEKTPNKCHRRLLAEECKKYRPKLKLIIK